MKVKRVLALAIGLSLVAGLFYCGSYVKISVVKKMPAGFMKMMQGKRNIGVIAVPPEKNLMQKIGIQVDWTNTVQSSLENSFNQYGYFRLVDVSKQADRLRQIAHSQSGMTTKSQAVGQELGADALLYVQMTNQPLQECKREMVTDAAAVAANLLAVATGGQANRPTKVRTGVRYVTVFVKGQLINVETGQMLVTNSSEPYRLENQAGNLECPSVLNAFNKAMESASAKVADGLSPRMGVEHVKLSDDPVGSPDNAADRVKAFLEQGNKWANTDPPNLERAAKSWENALDTSGNNSAAAYWNLGVAKWAAGDLEGAEEYFNKAEKIGGPDFYDTDKMEITSRFASEKKRIEQEKEAGED